MSVPAAVGLEVVDAPAREGAGVNGLVAARPGPATAGRRALGRVPGNMIDS
jgi:hypothetical protein